MSPLPWQTSLAEQVRQRLAGGGMPHAVLVSGPPGWGDEAFANWLALLLLGEDRDLDASTIAHPDLRWIRPDGAVIKVDAVRELAEFAHGTPQAGPRKVAVLAEAHCLNRNAANALLKTLEEPPPGTHLVLASCHPGRLLPTVRSRCQSLVIRPDPASARAWLEARLAARGGADDLERRLFEHGGAPVAVMDAVEAGERPLEDLLRRALEDPGATGVAKALLEGDLTDALARWYRYLLALAAGTWSLERLGPVPPRAVMAFADELVWVRRQLVSSNSANARLLAERLVDRWRRLAGRHGVNSVTARRKAL